MDRLTKKRPFGYGLVKVECSEQVIECRYPNTVKAICESFERLGRYEDIGLMPEEIKLLLRDGGITLAMRNRDLRSKLANTQAEKDAAVKELAMLSEARPIEEWGEDYGDCLWWKLPVEEPPYCGSPLDACFPDYVTHWTPLPACPHEMDEPEKRSEPWKQKIMNSFMKVD